MDGILSIFLLTGLFSLCLCISEPQYFILTPPKTWSEAQSFCREKCVDLVTIHGMNEMETLLEMVQDQYEDALWIGFLKGTSPTWHWSLADKRFYKEGERNYFNWGLQTTSNCGTFKNGLLYTVTCSKEKYAVCFDETRSGLEQYILTPELMTWMDAREYCRTYYTDLASVRNAAESQMIQEVSTGMEVWVGLFRDPWVWSDNSYSSLRYWRTGRVVYTDDNPACVAMIKNESGRWDERPCEQQLPFLCECSESLVTFQLTLTSATGLELKDPVVQKNILNQIKEKLHETNISGNATLHWRQHSDGSVFRRKLH